MNARRRSMPHREPEPEALGNSTSGKASPADERRPQATLSPRVKVRAGSDGQITPDGDQTAFEVAVAAATGTEHPELATRLIGQALDASGITAVQGPERENVANAVLAQLHGLEPHGVLEGMLGTQITAAHNLAMKMLARAETTDDVDVRAVNVGAATRLMRAFVAGVEAIQRLRGEGVKQVVRVEHVTVQAGGQAVVGTVSTRRGRG